MRIFLTGATGFIGGHLLAKLLSYSAICRVYALVRTESWSHSDCRVHVLRGDLERLEDHASALVDCDYVFHVGGNASFRGKHDYAATNVKPVEALVELLEGSKKLRCLVFTSTVGAIDRAQGDNCNSPLTLESTPSPRSCYGKSKLEAEEVLRQSGLPWTIVRPTWVYGKGMRVDSHLSVLVRLVARKAILTRLRLRGRVSLIHVRDLVSSLANCIDNPSVIGKTYFAQTESLSFEEIFATARRALQLPEVRTFPLPGVAAGVRRLHHVVPAGAAIPFVSYLNAIDESFFRDFGLAETVKFSTGVGDVINAGAGQGLWIVTGANSGIGQSIARLLSDRGEEMVLVDKEIDELSEFGQATVAEVDLRSAIQIRSFVERLPDRAIRCLVNNAGVAFIGGIDTLAEDAVADMAAVNMVAPMLLTKMLLPRLRRDRSTVVNVSSSVAFNPLPHMSVYSATKAGLQNWSESLSYELRHTNRVITVAPAGTRTNLQRRGGVRVLASGSGLLSPDRVAARILSAVEGGRRFVLIGLSTRALILMGRLLPHEARTAICGYLFARTRRK